MDTSSIHHLLAGKFALTTQKIFKERSPLSLPIQTALLIFYQSICSGDGAKVTLIVLPHTFEAEFRQQLENPMILIMFDNCVPIPFPVV
ncbi:MAG TPA: hypothetical protein VK211_03895 [Kamptonema sp.]|nr:hypothetical protein [Kamptonema sp.]